VLLVWVLGPVLRQVQEPALLAPEQAVLQERAVALALAEQQARAQVEPLVQVLR